MKPTYEELESELRETKEELRKTMELLKIALDKIAELEEKLNLNSNNSSKPPSSDQKNNTPPKPPKKRKKRKGVARASFPPERIDNHVECTLENCSHCGSGSIRLSDLLPEIWQQAELPEVKAIITEYKLQKYCCNSCGQNSTADLPEGVPYSAFGPKLMGLMATLTGVFHLAKREAIHWSQRNRRLGHCKRRVKLQLEDGMANGSDKLYRLSENLLDNFEKMWTFMQVPGMEPTNNLAERDLRKLVVWRKKSYGTRSERGKRFVERITTVAQTLKRKGANVLKFIQDSIICFYRKVEVPFISESLGY